MRVAVVALAAFFVVSPFALGVELTEEQKEVWNTLEKQVALDMKKDVEAEKKYIHPQACLWGDQFPAPVRPTEKTNSYYKKWLDAQDDIVAHLMTPVSVLVVDDVAIINFYLQILTRDDEGEHDELVVRGHNTWKKENDRWLLFATCNTMVNADDDGD